jgi:hypothetical protein
MSASGTAGGMIGRGLRPYSQSVSSSSNTASLVLRQSYSTSSFRYLSMIVRAAEVIDVSSSWQRPAGARAATRC